MLWSSDNLDTPPFSIQTRHTVGLAHSLSHSTREGSVSWLLQSRLKAFFKLKKLTNPTTTGTLGLCMLLRAKYRRSHRVLAYFSSHDPTVVGGRVQACFSLQCGGWRARVACAWRKNDASRSGQRRPLLGILGREEITMELVNNAADIYLGKKKRNKHDLPSKLKKLYCTSKYIISTH